MKMPAKRSPASFTAALKASRSGNTPVVRVDSDNFVSCRRWSRGVTGMREDGRNNGVAFRVVPACMISPHNGCGGVHGMVAATRLEGDAVHAGDFLDHLLEAIHKLQSALAGAFIL